MSENLPYKEIDQQFNDLPVPDEEASWQKMKELLDDDDDTVVSPPVFLKTCLGWGILFLAGLAVAWLIVRPEKWLKETSSINRTSPSKKNESKIINSNPVENTTTYNQELSKERTQKKTTASQLTKQTPQLKVVNTPKPNEAISSTESQVSRKTGKNISINKLSTGNQNLSLGWKQRKTSEISKLDLRKGKKPVKIVVEENQGKANSKNIDSVSINQSPNQNENDIIPGEENQNKTKDTTTIASQTIVVQVDTISKLKANQPTDSSNQKNTNPKPKRLLIAGGISEQQLIPIAGQTTVPYSRYGRKGSLADYVPSVFVQLQKERKWFLQTEFRYGAAQSVKEFSYNQNTHFDVVSGNITTTTMRLKKTYYHQLPVSFNYFLLTNVSIGIGGMYSHFYGAITEKETTIVNAQTQAASTIKQIIPVKHFTDSFLYKTQIHALVQADYHWKQFSFGLRYTKDVQPYIKYTRPDGTVDEEKNQSLQFIVRYRLWKSAKQ